MKFKVEKILYLKQYALKGKYDINKVEGFLKSLVIETGGFNIFKDIGRQNLIKVFAKKFGIIILTDSDIAGKKIANFVASLIDDGEVIFCSVPKIIGKEKRKSNNKKESVLGVESIKKEIIINSLKQSGAKIYFEKNIESITRKDFIELGFFGDKESNIRRRQLLKYIGFDVNFSVNQLIKVINMFYYRDEFFKICDEIKKRSKLWSSQT